MLAAVRTTCLLPLLLWIAQATVLAESSATEAKPLFPLTSVSLSQTGSLADGTRQATSAATVTFTRDIAPIVFQSCASCHHPGDSAPFTLLNYEDVRQRATQIALLTQRRDMPPWKPEPGYGEFSGARRLSDGQIGLIQRWVQQGAVEGDPEDLPPTPTWTPGWQLGPPDIVVTMPEPYVLGSGGSDEFRTFVIPVPLTTARYIKGMELRLGTTKAIHHENTKIDRTGSSRRQDIEDSQPGFSGSAGPNARFPGGHFQGWTPGQVPRMLPDGMSWLLEPGSDLVVEMHMVPTGKSEALRVSIGLFFADGPPTRVPYILRLGRQTIDIPAGEKAYVSTDAYVLPVDVEVLEVYPHAHYLAREVQGIARLPDGTTRWLINIKAWDFRWQDNYRFVEALLLPRGTTLEMQYTYDNSAENPRNPNHPPKRVTFGPNSSDEMGDLWIQVVPLGSRDALERDYSPKMVRQEIEGREKVLEVHPNDSRLRVELASRYLDAGRMADAVAQLEEALRLEPASPLAHHDLGAVLLRQGNLEEAGHHFTEAGRLSPRLYEAFSNLGVVRYLQGKPDEAIVAYNQALGIRPDSVDTRYSLGTALASRGRFEDAISEYRQALHDRPDDPEIHSSLGSLLAIGGRLEEAIRHYREALRVRPDMTDALLDLAWILATTDRLEFRAPGEAVRLAELAADRTKYQDPTALDTLAAAYAAAGDLGRAISTAQAALALATVEGAEALAGEIRRRLDSYTKRVR